MKKTFNYAKAAFWIGLIFLLYMFAILTSETGKNYQLRSRSEELEQQITQLESQIEELGYRVTYYRTPGYQERVAREKLGLKAPGENVVIVQKDATTPESEPTTQSLDLKTPEEIEASKSHLQQWRDFLFGS